MPFLSSSSNSSNNTTRRDSRTGHKLSAGCEGGETLPSCSASGRRRQTFIGVFGPRLILKTCGLFIPSWSTGTTTEDKEQEF